MTSGVTISHQIYNGLEIDILVKTKTGFTYAVKGQGIESRDRRSYVTVVLEGISYGEIIDIDPSKALTKFDKELMTELKREYDERVKQCSTPDGKILLSARTWTLGFRVNIETNLEENNSAHSEFLGCSFMPGLGCNNQEPLFSPEYDGQSGNKELTKSLDIAKNSLLVNIFINDPDRMLGKLWVNTMGKAKIIPSLNRQDLRPGLYITDNGDENLPCCQYYCLADLTEKFLASIGIYENRREAIQFANSETINDLTNKVKSLEKRYIQGQDDNKDLKKLMEKTDAVNLNLITELSRLKHEMKITSLITKFNQDQAKQRKPVSDFSETCKALAGILTAGFAVYKTFTA